jgi:anti-sigma regulatory factor (Ser/Thr protein kinase)
MDGPGAHIVSDTSPDVIVRDARREHLAAIIAFVADRCAAEGVPADVAFDLRLATEEVVTNVIEHGYAGLPPGPVLLRFHLDGANVVLTVEDLAAPFDPARVRPPDPDAPLEQRPLGGLGWHLANAVMDEVRHERLTPKGNRLTLTKRLSPS